MLRLLAKYKLTCLVAIAVFIGIAVWSNSRSFDDNAMAGIPLYENIDESSVLSANDVNALLEPSYHQYYRQHEDGGAIDSTGYHRTIASLDYTAVSDAGTRLEADLGGAFDTVLALVDEGSWVEYRFDVPESGFYQMAVSYYALSGKRSSVIRSVQIDGAYPFYQAKQMEFQRMWTEAGDPWFDNQGNEYNPAREEVAGWQRRELRDAQGKVLEPFRIYLTEGTHTVRIGAIREPAAIGQLDIYSPVKEPDYDDILASYSERGYEATEGVMVKVQAEAAGLRSSPTLKRLEDREPLTEPFNKDAIALNSFGGSGWRTGGQWAEWDFEVPESGLYEIGARFGQFFVHGVPVQRMITIDGKLPFREMNEWLFPYDQEWQISRFGTEEEDYLFYLEAGRHTIRMEVQLGFLGEIMDDVTAAVRKMSYLNREIIQVTGTNPDPNGDWQLERNIPALVPRLHLMARDIDEAIKRLYKLGVPQGSSEVSALYEARDQLLDMAAEPTTIPAQLQSFSDMQSMVGTWMNGVGHQSLILDYLIVKSPDQPWPKRSAGWLARAGTSLYDFARSFTRDYSGIGNTYDDEQTIEVWVARGRDWVEIIKQMIDEDFTPESGIKVNVNVIPAGQSQVLLLAETSGLSPDAALGIEAEVPIDFAVRGGIVNLNEFPDYEQVAQRFRPGALIPYRYNDGDYALPETQNFSMLFYRKDIMAQLGIAEADIPDTWQEVMDLIPLLQQNGMDFYYPHAPNNTSLAMGELAPFLFQHGGDFYRANGSVSALDEPEALEAIRMWTGLFTNYRIQKQADFYNRMRSGEMPIGIADYSTYVLLSTGAPELTGWWGMKPMPGIAREDGVTDRSTGGLAQTGMIFKSSKKQQQAWELLKWWTSADTQERFGSELEALLGVEARWNTSNIEALQRLPWPKEDIDAIMEQWQWFRERQIVIGGYYTSRHIANIWNEIVLNGKLPREAIEDAVKEINKELRKKREEFRMELQQWQNGQQEGGEKR